MDLNKDSDVHRLVFPLRALHTSVTEKHLLTKPELCHLVVEHACWDLAIADWHARQPRRWRRGTRRQWIAEGRSLFDDLDELLRLAHQLDLR
jgi:hypothetical protein